MAQDLGTLYVKLAADASALVKGLASGLESIKKFAQQIKEITEPIAAAVTALTAVGGAAVALASTVDDRAYVSLGKLHDATALLAVQVADVLEPTLRSLTQAFRDAANWVAGIDPALKTQIATWATWAVGIGVAAKALGLIAGVVASATGAILAIGQVVGALALPITALVAIVVLLHKAWRENWLGIQQAVGQVIEWIKANIGEFGSLLYRAMVAPLEIVLDGVLAIVDAIAKMNNALGRPDIGWVSEMTGALKGLQAGIRSGDIFKEAVKTAVAVAEDTGGAIMKELPIIWKEIKGAVGLDSMASKFHEGTARQPEYVDREVSYAGTHNDPTAEARPWINSIMATTAKTVLATGATAWVNQISAVNLAFQNAQEAISRANWSSVIDAVGPQFDEAAAAWSKVLGRNLTWAEQVQLATDAIGGTITKYSASVQKSLKKANPADTWGQLNASQKTIGEFMKRMSNQILGNMGKLGQTISAIADGAKAGGVWGAIIAAAMQIFQQMKGFQRLLDFAEEGLAKLAEFLSPLLGWLFDIISELTAVFTEWLGKILDALKPLFDGLKEFFDAIAPILSIIAVLTQFLAPILNALAKAIGAILKALGPVIKVIFEVVKYIVIAVGYVFGAVIQVINWIEQFLAWLIELFGDRKAAAEMRANMTNMNEYWQSLKDLSKMTWEDQKATDAATASAWDAAIANKTLADSAQSVSEQLTNVPSGYKIALSRYQQMLREGETPYGINQDMSSAPSVYGGVGVVVNGDINITTSGDSVSIANSVRSEAMSQAQKTGTWYGGRRTRAVGG